MALRVAALWVLCTFFIGSAVVYGRTQADANDLPALGFNKCDGKPCFMSLNLNEYNMDTLREKLVHLPNSVIDPESQWDHLISMNGITYLVESYSDALAIKPVESDTRLNLGEFIQYYGEPCGMMASEPIPNVMLIYPAMQVYVVFSGKEWQERLSHSMPVLRVEMVKPVNDPYAPSCNDRKWLGFAAMRFYWDRGLVWAGD